jgi:hypothetical protein
MASIGFRPIAVRALASTARNGLKPCNDIKLSAQSHFRATFLPIARSRTPLPKKELFHAACECLLGMWQTDNRGERFVPMVRTAEEAVLGSLCGGIESGVACCGGVPRQAWAHPSKLNCRSAAQFAWRARPPLRRRASALRTGGQPYVRSLDRGFPAP